MLCEKRSFVTIAVLGILLFCLFPCVAAAQLVWQTSKQEAVKLAVQKKKKVLLLAGREA
jgi:hypothetical protein